MYLLKENVNSHRIYVVIKYEYFNIKFAVTKIIRKLIVHDGYSKDSLPLYYNICTECTVYKYSRPKVLMPWQYTEDHVEVPSDAVNKTKFRYIKNENNVYRFIILNNCV